VGLLGSVTRYQACRSFESGEESTASTCTADLVACTSFALERCRGTMSENCLIIEGADLIDGSGSLPIKDATIVLEENRIVYAGPKTDRFNTFAARHWSLLGKTIVPGLIEAHTHAAFDGDMRAYVKNGVTTIRFAGLDQATFYT
jgi:adenine deaminase